MSDPKLDKQLSQLRRKHEKVREVLERELSSERAQAESARTAQEEGAAKLTELEAKRPALAADVFSDKARSSELDDLDKQMAEARQQIEIASYAEEQAASREQGIAKRLEEADHEAAEARYDLYATHRKEGTLELEKTLDSLTAQLDALLELDLAQRAEEPTLGILPSGMSYAELLEGHLSLRLSKHLPATRHFASGVDMRTVGLSLAEKDYRTQLLTQQRTEHEAEVREAEEHAAQQERARQESERRNEFAFRRAQLRAWRGYDSSDSPEQGARRRQIDADIANELSDEYGDLLEEERLAREEQQKQEVRSTLLAPGEDYESLSEERRAEVDAAVEEWVANGAAAPLAPHVQ